MKVTLAVEADLGDIANLFNLYRVFYKQESDIDGAIAYLSDRLKNRDSVIYLVRNVEGVCLGFTQLYPTFSSQSMQRMWILNDLYVREEYRNSGVASVLIDAAKACSISSAAKGLMLCTQHTNSKAQSLYKKLGFAPLNEFQWFFLKT